MSQLAEIYKTYSNTSLLRIVENPGDYRPEAVDTAHAELESRNLSAGDISQARAELEAEEQQAMKKKQKREELKNSLQEKGASILDYISPIESDEDKEDTEKPPKLINTIAIVFCIIALLQIITQFDLITALFTDMKWDFSVVLFLFPLIVTPLAAVLFWMKKRAGWVLLAIYLGYAVMGFLWMFFMSFEPTFLLGSLFFSGTLWCISQERVRNVYRISVDAMYSVIIASICLVGIILAVYFFVL